MNEQLAVAEPAPRELAEVVLVLRRHARVSGAIIGLFLVLAAIVTLAAPRFYRAEATLSYDPQVPMTKGGGELPMTDAQRDAGVDVQLAAAATLPVAEDVARGVDLAANPRLADEAEAIGAASEHGLSREEALGTALLHHLKARRIGQTALFTIGYTAGSSEQAARIANLFAAGYLKAAVQQKAALTAGSGALDARLAQARRQMDAADDRLAAFRLANNLLNAPDSLALEQEVAGLRGQLSEARGQAALAGRRGASANATTVVDGGYGGSVDTTPVSALTQQRAAAAADLAALLGRYGEKHPDVIAARQKLRELDAQLATAMHGNRASAMVEADAADARAGAVSGSLNDAEARLTGTLRHDAQLVDLENNALALRQAYQDLLKLGADQTAQRALIAPDAQVVVAASPPQRPLFPRLGIDLLGGLVLGLAAAAAVAVLRDSWLHDLASVEDIERWLEMDYFAPLPELARGDPVVAVLNDPRSGFATGFRSLAGAALYAAGAAPNADPGAVGRVIAIASARPGEGKTTCAIAMARVLAAGGTKLALVDGGDGSASARLGSGTARGWQDVIAGGAGLDEVVRIDASGFALVPAAAGGWTDNAGFVRMIDALRRDYELVIIDTPALLTAHPGPGLLSCADALVLLARWRGTPVRDVRAAIRQVAMAGGRVSGVALSRVRGA